MAASPAPVPVGEEDDADETGAIVSTVRKAQTDQCCCTDTVKGAFSRGPAVQHSDPMCAYVFLLCKRASGEQLKGPQWQNL